MRLQKSSKDAATIGAATMNDLKQKYDASTVAVLRQAMAVMNPVWR
jgi:K+/H+ antiporter YhaU regulatory subunit KhtT